MVFHTRPVFFYRATRMHRADYAVARCLSVRLSVCPSHAGIMSKRLCTVCPKKFSPSASPTILVFPHQTGWQYSDQDPLTEALNTRGMKQELSYRQQIARKLRTQYAEGIYRHEYYTVTLKSRLMVTGGHCMKRNQWIDHIRLISSRVI